MPVKSIYTSVVSGLDSNFVPHADREEHELRRGTQTREESAHMVTKATVKGNEDNFEISSVGARTARYRRHSTLIAHFPTLGKI